MLLKKDLPHVIECKYKAEEFEIRNLKIFRRIYPEEDNIEKGRLCQLSLSGPDTLDAAFLNRSHIRIKCLLF